MFEKITDEEERGQIGIGTLIIFIAMILVAAVAAGVLINTAGLLQAQADDTASDTQQAVANQIEVIHAVGDVNQSENVVETLNLTVKMSAGSEEIDLNSTTVQYTSGDQDTALQLNDVNDTSQANSDGFVATQVAGDENADDPTSLIHTDERVVLTLAVDDIEGDNGNGSGLGPGESVTIQVVDQSGASYTYGVSVPNTFGDREVVQV